MANEKKRKLKGFDFKPFSAKQLKLLNWWMPESPVSERFMCIADGAIRSGKTVAMALSFILFVMNTFNQQDALMAGKSVGTFRRNVLNSLKQMLITLGFECVEHRSENYVEIKKGEVVNYFYIAGAKDESAQDYIQGMSLCGVLLDK